MMAAIVKFEDFLCVFGMSFRLCVKISGDEGSIYPQRREVDHKAQKV
jgi:hypothetical protein